jgi:hypothetical protein
VGGEPAQLVVRRVDHDPRHVGRQLGAVGRGRVLQQVDDRLGGLLIAAEAGIGRAGGRLDHLHPRLPKRFQLFAVMVNRPEQLLPMDGVGRIHKRGRAKKRKTARECFGHPNAVLFLGSPLSRWPASGEVCP